MGEAVYRAILLPQRFSVILASVNSSVISVIVCTLVLVFALVGSYIRKLLRQNRTKDIAILGLREIIRLLEKKIK